MLKNKFIPPSVDHFYRAIIHKQKNTYVRIGRKKGNGEVNCNRHFPIAHVFSNLSCDSEKNNDPCGRKIIKENIF